MFALLGEIEFDLITYFDGFEWQAGANYAEHALIDGKPRLQFIGESLDEIRIQLAFHLQYCDPERELLKLREAKAAHRAMAFVLGNGDYKGWFVLTEVQATSRHTDKAGSLVALEASITLREFVGDKRNPIAPPAVQPKLPPAAAQAQPASAAQLVSTTKSVGNRIRQAVTYANQTQSSLRVAIDAVRTAQKLRENPLAAMGRIPSLLTNMKQVSTPLEKLSPSLAGLTDRLPETASIVRASDSALRSVRDGQALLSSADAKTITGRIDTLASQLSTASSALNSAAPGISKLAGQVATRAL
jgi:phage protein U